MPTEVGIRAGFADRSWKLEFMQKKADDFIKSKFGAFLPTLPIFLRLTLFTLEAIWPPPAKIALEKKLDRARGPVFWDFYSNIVVDVS